MLRTFCFALVGLLLSANIPALADADTAATHVDEPCGFVEFINLALPKYDRAGTVSQRILMRVHYNTKRIEAVNLDYMFVYPNEAASPWSQRNILREMEVRFQFPPAEKRASEPDVVQYVMKHTTPDGFTTLKECKGM